jgi:hypothetical protein
MQFVLSRHAQHEMRRRAIPLALLDSVLQQPPQIIVEASGKKSINHRWTSVMVKSFCCAQSSPTMSIQLSS